MYLMFFSLLSLDIVEPAFYVPTDVLIGKVIYALVGMVMMLIAIMSKKQKNSC